MKKRIFFTAFVLALFLLLAFSVSAERQPGEAWGIYDGYIYSIVRDSSMTAFDVDNGGVSDGTTISLYHYYSENPWQQWQFIYNPENLGYFIKDMHSGKYLTVENNSTVDGARLCIQPQNESGEGQIFRVENNSSGTVLLYTKSSNYQMVVTADASGGAIRQRTKNNATYQRYRIIVGGGIFQFKNKENARVVDVAGNGRENGNNVVQYTRTAGCRWQQWKLLYLGDNLYKIKSMSCGLLLTVESSAENANVYVNEENGSINQLFRLQYNIDGTFTILTGASGYGKAITPYNEGMINDISIVQNTISLSDPGIQSYYLVRVGESEITEGIYYYQCTATGKYAQVDDGSGSHLEQHGYNGTRKQQWRIEYVRNNFYKIINVSTGYALTAPDSLSNNQNVYTEPYNGSTRQEWYFILLRSGNYEIRCNYWDTQGNTVLVLAVGTSIGNTNLNGTNIRQITRSNTERREWKMIGGNGLAFLQEPDVYVNTAYFNVKEKNFIDAGFVPNTYCTYSVLQQGTSAEDIKLRLATAKIIELNMHGSVNSLYSADPLTLATVKNLENNIFSNAQLVLLNACSCGEGGANADNIANAIFSKGAQKVMSYDKIVDTLESNKWYNKFYDYYLSGCSVAEAIKLTNIYFDSLHQGGRYSDTQKNVTSNVLIER